jgi:hypothetical protein
MGLLSNSSEGCREDVRSERQLPFATSAKRSKQCEPYLSAGEAF